MHVREWGNAGGRPLVFWHALGSGTSGAYMTEIAPTLTGAGLRLFAPDAPGFGESPALPPEQYRTEAVVEAVRGLLDERGIDRAILMGHSWGGTIVTAFAAAQDQPSSPHGKSFEDLVEEYGRPERGVRTTVAVPTPEVRAAAMWGLMDTRVSESWPAIAGAGIPILLFVATEPLEARDQNQRAVPRFREAFPDAEVVVLEGAGHDLFADAGPELGRIVAAWAGRH